VAEIPVNKKDRRRRKKRSLTKGANEDWAVVGVGVGTFIIRRGSRGLWWVVRADVGLLDVGAGDASVFVAAVSADGIPEAAVGLKKNSKYSEGYPKRESKKKSQKKFEEIKR
jgi:hypothetical protein